MATHPGPCRFFYYVNDGCSLPFLGEGAVTFVYSWDSMVHFHRSLIRRYLKEIARVLEPGGAGFVHHSNWGAAAPESNFRDNPSWRSNVSRETFAADCEMAGLRIHRQDLIPWDGIEGA
jgi:SAM-dependent methyltransferase